MAVKLWPVWCGEDFIGWNTIKTFVSLTMFVDIKVDIKILEAHTMLNQYEWYFDGLLYDIYPTA